MGRASLAAVAAAAKTTLALLDAPADAGASHACLCAPWCLLLASVHQKLSTVEHVVQCAP
eukprot:1152030-Pelagomonas_calceolata.AAC.15